MTIHESIRRYISEINSIKDKDSRIEKSIKDYLVPFEEIFKLYNTKYLVKSYYDNEENICRIVLDFTDNKSGFSFHKKSMKGNLDTFTFTKNLIIIQKQGLFGNFNPMQGFIDYEYVLNEITDAEAKHLQSAI